MRATIEHYHRHLQALMPRGRAWPTEQGALLIRLLGGFAGGLSRHHNRAVDLIDEADPRTTVELLTDWERICGLPDGCLSLQDTTVDRRRSAVVAKITARGGQSRQFFISLAAGLGYAVTIDEFKPFTCESRCEDPCYDEKWASAWRINAPKVTVQEFNCESPCEEPLRNWGNKILECAIKPLNPAHTHVIFGYGG